MNYLLSIVVDPITSETLSCQVRAGSTIIALDNTYNNVYRNEHAEIIELVLSDRSKLVRLCDLLDSDPNTAFGIFCDENDIYIHDLEGANPDGLINGN